MTVKQQIDHWNIQRVCHLHFSSHSSGSHFVNFNLLPSLCYLLKITNDEMREKKIFGIYGCFGVLRYMKGDTKAYP